MWSVLYYITVIVIVQMNIIIFTDKLLHCVVLYMYTRIIFIIEILIETSVVMAMYSTMTSLLHDTGQEIRPTSDV